MLLALHNVVAGFLRRTWLVALATVIVCASFAARAVASLSDVALASAAAAPPGAAVAPPATPPPAPTRPPPDGDAFVARNVFCSSCTPPEPGPGGGATYQGHPAVLIATSISAEPRATVRVLPTEVQGSWGLGEDIPGVGRIDEIHPTSIEVADTAGNTTRISLLDATAAGPGETGAATPETGPAAPKRPFEGRIEKVDATTFQIERGLVRELVTGASRRGMGGATPVVVDGEIKGVRLFGIGTSSPAHAIELRSGDLISSIDGVPLRNAQQLLDLFAKLDSVSSVELGGTHRDRKPLQRTLRLR